MSKYRYFLSFLFVLAFFFSSYLAVKAQSISQRLSGSILLDVERNGEAWYVYPENNRRHYLGRPHDAFAIMRELGLGINETDFSKLKTVEDEDEGDVSLAKKLSGKIVLQVEKNGEAWYIYPNDLKKYYLGRPDDAFSIMRNLGLGISRKDLAFVNKNSLDENIDEYSSYKHRFKHSYNNKDFFLDIIEIDLNNPSLKIVTETANSFTCTSSCPAKGLIDYVIEHNAFAAINGSYFDTGGRLNYYFAPVYNTRLFRLINDNQLVYPTTGPMIVFDESNNFYYFKDSREFKSVEHFESVYNTKIQAAISNRPRLIENNQSLLIEWEMDEAQKYIKATRNAIGFKAGTGNSKGSVYLMVVRNVTMIELSDILLSMGMDYALNLDGGYSTALYYNGEYMMGPGRNIPNAILFSSF